MIGILIFVAENSSYSSISHCRTEEIVDCYNSRCTLCYGGYYIDGDICTGKYALIIYRTGEMVDYYSNRCTLCYDDYYIGLLYNRYTVCMVKYN